MHRGPRVHGRKYKKVEERDGEWVALVSDQQLDTLNAELLLLRNGTQPTRPEQAASSLEGTATVRLLFVSVGLAYATMHTRGTHWQGRHPQCRSC